jgi:flagellar protein FlaG
VDITALASASTPASAPVSGETTSVIALDASSAPPDQGVNAGAPAEDLNPDLDLVIEDDKAAGEYVYMTVNRLTGEVVNQWPSKQLLQLREASDYSPGEVIEQVA